MSLTKTSFSMIAGSCVNIVDFGASPTASGATNATAIQAALDTGKGVFIPDGDYDISSTLTVNTEGQKIDFESRNAKFICTSDITLFELNNSFIEITNGLLIGAATDTTSTTSGIHIKDCTRSRFAFVDIRTFGYGIKMFDYVRNFINTIDACHFFENRRAGIYGCGHGTSIMNGEISKSEYGVLMAQVQPGADLKIDRNVTGSIGDMVAINAVTIESIGNNKAISNVINNGAGAVRVASAGHGYSTGDFVSVWGVTGVTGATGVWPITVITNNVFDLKTSTFGGGYTGGGTVRRGVGVYASIGNPGPIIQGCYFEDVSILAQFGDTYENNGTTPHSSFANEGGVVDRNFFLNNVSTLSQPQASSILVANRLRSGQVSNNYCANTANLEIVNNKDDDLGGAIFSYNNIFSGSGAVNYSATGTQGGNGLIINPRTRNAGSSLIVNLPTTSGATTVGAAFQVANFLDSAFVATVVGGLRVLGVITLPDSVQIITGSGSPEGVVTAVVGSTYSRIDGGTNTSFYVKESGTGNTGWSAK
jgi:hypothetical protein